MNPIVEAVHQLNIAGNIVPNEFFETIKQPKTGKPHLLAIMIMADILYWYRPTEIRDEATGETLEWRQKFKADMLQKSYAAHAERFGVSKRQIKDAYDLLRGLGLVTTELRVLITPQGPISNVMFVAPVVATVQAILGVKVRDVPPPTKKRTTSSGKCTPPPTINRGTYTNNTTNIMSSEIETNDPSYILATTLFDLLKHRKPNIRRANIDNWANAIRVMLNEDEREYDKVLKVIRWAQADNFWWKNIMSPESLRRHYDQLEARMEGEASYQLQLSDKDEKAEDRATGNREEANHEQAAK